MDTFEQTRKGLLVQAVVSGLGTLAVVGALYSSLGAPGGAAASGVPALYWLGLLVVAGSWAAIALRLRGLSIPGRAKSAAVPPPPKPKEEPRPAVPPQATALQMLALLQRQGRLLDFLHEDLGQYDDAQIGAAVRSVHAGCKEALAEVARLEPVLSDQEGSDVSVPQGFDARSIRLIGNVKGKPPFRGVLRHRGWRVQQLRMPASQADPKAEPILAPAEVEVHG
jgi:hypothetical protein